MRALAVVLLLFFCAQDALPQGGRRDGDDRQRWRRERMSDEERQRMREDMREAYRDRSADRERPPMLSPQERDKLRQDIQDANRDLRRGR